MWVQGVPAGKVHNHFRAADHRAVRIRSGASVPGAASRAAHRGGGSALGALASDKDQLVARQRADVPGCGDYPLECATWKLSKDPEVKRQQARAARFAEDG